MGLSAERQYQNYHRVLNRAKWSGLQVSRIGLRLLVAAFVKPDEPVVLGVDETLERRRGKQIKARGIFRDAVRSSKTYTVYSAGLRWVSFIPNGHDVLLARVPWSQRVWGLPVLTALAPSRKTNRANGQRHKTSIDWIAQMIAALRRWLPQHKRVLSGWDCAVPLLPIP